MYHLAHKHLYECYKQTCVWFFYFFHSFVRLLFCCCCCCCYFGKRIYRYTELTLMLSSTPSLLLPLLCSTVSAVSVFRYIYQVKLSVIFFLNLAVFGVESIHKTVRRTVGKTINYSRWCTSKVASIPLSSFFRFGF